MGESANKLRSEIDVAEFERRLRAPAASTTYEDPLAELARLVDAKNQSGDDPFRELFAAPRQAPERRAPAAPALGRQRAFFADLRGSLDHEQAAELPPDATPSQPPVAASEFAAEEEYGDPAAWADQEAAYAEPQIRVQRSRRPLYAMGAIVCAGLVGIGASFAMRSKAPGSQELALVKAASGPVKVAPENPGGLNVPNQSASVLDRAAGSQVAKVVSREEQPVDLDQQVKQMRVITLGGPKDGSVSSGQGAASVPVPPPPAASVSTRNNGFPEPKRVKTVSVRPDGSLVVAEASPTPSADPIAAIAAGRPAPAASSEGALPKSATPKASARITPPSVEAAAPGDQAVSTTPPPAKPKVAAAKPKPEPTRVASAQETDATPTQSAATGGFAVQLAAPGSEQDARSISNKLGQKFAGILDGHRPSVVKAEIGDKSIYRVRVGSLSREEATSLCGKIKSKGGECFVAKN
ncbi:MAG: SPOR domain-containing protein [Methylobacteriaceae bacterium]|nr:SPOR domain-containing protein [Methylobacteriaceae bacterium]